MITTKSKAKAAANKKTSLQINTATEPGQEQAAIKARNVIAPTIQGAVTTLAFTKAFGETDLQAMVDALSKENEKVRSGDLSRAENLLMTQAHTLDAIFNELARRAALNMGEYINAAERYMRLALKAQSQCRATLETLATIKNPPVIYAKQANIANGPQQVNNGTLPAPAHGENTIEPNKLLEQQHAQRLDNGTTGKTIGTDSAMATMG